MKRQKRDVEHRGWGVAGMAAAAIGLGLAGLGVFLLLSFATADVGVDPDTAAKTCWTGLLGAWIAFGGIHTFGVVPAVVLAMLLVFWGLHVAVTMRFLATWPQVIGGAMLVAAISLGCCAAADSYDMGTGGLLAVYVSPPAILYFGRWGLVVAAVCIMILGILLAFGESAIYSVHWFLYGIRDTILGVAGLGARVLELLRMLVTPRLAVAGEAVRDRAGPAGGTREREKRSLQPKTVKKNPPEAEEEAGGDVAEDSAAGEPESEALDEISAVADSPLDAPAASVDLGEAVESKLEADNSASGDEANTAERPEVKDWKPRDGFVSRFLNLDFRPETAEAPAPAPEPEPEPVDAIIAPRREDAEAPSAPKADVILDVVAEAEESDAAEQPEQAVSEQESPAPMPAPVRDPLDIFGDAVAEPEAAELDEAEGVEEEKAPFQPAMLSESGPELELEPVVEPESVALAAPAPVRTPPPVARPAASGTTRPGSYGSDTADRSEKSEKSKSAQLLTDFSEYRLPPLELLDPPEPPVVEDRSLVEAKAKILEQTLSEFKIEGRVVHVERGPRVTLYEISLAPGIRLNKVTSLADNIAMQLQAESIRIIAPIPGKNTIGIEIPNTTKELVSLREIVSSVTREKRRQALPICLGKDISGSALVADLTRMPHLLIAGATGSGKSVCINSIILSIMMCCRPDEAQLIMVDPKVVELSRFKDIPHLMSPVITDMKRAVSVLEWICQKMDERYEQMSQVSVNNIAKFNALGEEGIRHRLDAFASLEEIEAFPKKMPYMVVIIDELADLMMVAGKEVEHHITRLAAKSRAVGIHLILATQRPSVDVITGLIKANMPCRIAFQVASRVDSRTILDQNGADSLLGAGDMLFLPPGVGKLTRAQGVFVSDEELFRVVDFTKAEAEPQYHSDLIGPVIGGGNSSVDISDFDELFIQSGEAIIENQRGSVSLLQRKFGIGYGRASRIIDQLASVGLLGPFRDGKAREILLTMEEFDAKFGSGGGDDGGWDDNEDDGSLAGLRDDERERERSPWEED